MEITRTAIQQRKTKRLKMLPKWFAIRALQAVGWAVLGILGGAALTFGLLFLEAVMG